MAKRIGGARRKTRGKLSKSIFEKGRIRIKAYFQKFNEGDKIALVGDSSYQDGMYFRRFHGKSAVVKGKQGKCYIVEIKDGGKTKKVIVHPIHMKRLN